MSFWVKQVWLLGRVKGKVTVPPKVSQISPLGTMHCCTKCHGNLSNSCWDIASYISRLTEIAKLRLLASMKLQLGAHISSCRVYFHYCKINPAPIESIIWRLLLADDVIIESHTNVFLFSMCLPVSHLEAVLQWLAVISQFELLSKVMTQELLEFGG